MKLWKIDRRQSDFFVLGTIAFFVMMSVARDAFGSHSLILIPVRVMATTIFFLSLDPGNHRQCLFIGGVSTFLHSLVPEYRHLVPMSNILSLFLLASINISCVYLAALLRRLLFQTRTKAR